MDIKEKTIIILKRYEIGSKYSYLPVLPKAAVLIPLFQRDGELHVLMTLRSLELRSNAGEVCFPGGKRDPGDRDDVATALREAEEEIGLPPDQVEVVCSLFPVMNQRGLLVVPVVGFIDESFAPRPNPAEVSAVFTVPLEFFTKAGAHSAYNPTGLSTPLHSFLYQDPKSGISYQVWGLTAMLAILVASLALRNKPEFDAGFDSDNPITFFQHNLNKRINKL
ncbi:peroxisomal coenzyme A diphosphatase NUDT7 [Osmerus mordax]|uniref:peroxisomal coenzyme A diphosphatase NUDT7 n=1 Tax=Osmerus mordax TaxID=8014 RepID=UPI00350E9BA9